MEFELHADGTLTPLPKQNVDTGMGVERTAAILQDVISVYETDGYQAIMDWIAAESGVAYGDVREGDEGAPHPRRPRPRHDVPRRRTASSPSNEGRGYVLRRIIRRAVQQARAIGLDRPLARSRTSSSSRWGRVSRARGAPRARSRRSSRAEEERFSQTLERGLRLFEEVAADRATISGDDAFRLHDTYGFPLELTRELARRARPRRRRGGVHAADGRAARALASRRRTRRGSAASSPKRPASRPSSSATRRRRC